MKSLSASSIAGSMAGEDVERLVVEELHADVFERLERGLVDALELLRPQHLDRIAGIDDLSPRRLFQAGAPARRAAIRTAPSRHVGLANDRGPMTASDATPAPPPCNHGLADPNDGRADESGRRSGAAIEPGYGQNQSFRVA